MPAESRALPDRPRCRIAGPGPSAWSWSAWSFEGRRVVVDPGARRRGRGRWGPRGGRGGGRADGGRGLGVGHEVVEALAGHRGGGRGAEPTPLDDHGDQVLGVRDRPPAHEPRVGLCSLVVAVPVLPARGKVDRGKPAKARSGGALGVLDDALEPRSMAW